MFLYFINVLMYLDKVKDIQRYYISKWYLIFVMPGYNFVIFWIRFAGIINSIKGEGKWKTTSLTEEWHKIKTVVNDDFRFPKRIVAVIKRKVNQ